MFNNMQNLSDCEKASQREREKKKDDFGDVVVVSYFLFFPLCLCFLKI